MKINSKIHFIGISGIGMSGIAELMLDKGYLIHGSDMVLHPGFCVFDLIHGSHSDIVTLIS